MKRTPSHGYLTVKEDLFKSDDYNEQDLIDLQKYNEGFFRYKLSQIFGYFEATYYIMDDEDNHIREIHLFSDKPFSFNEIRVLRERLLVAFGTEFKEFKVYQEPDGDQDVDGWMKLRKDTDDYTEEEKHSSGINRKIGLIYSFKSNRFGKKKIDFKQYHKNKKLNKNKKVTKKDIVDKILTVAMKMTKTKRLAEYDLVEFSKRTTDGYKELYIEIKSNDFRISEMLENEMINQAISKRLSIDRIVVKQETKPIEVKD